MRALVFETPGLLDLRSLTVMGLNAKPSATNPIGQFGTGLKYAVAALTRLSTPPMILVGENRYSFITRSEEFRGSTVELIDLVGPLDRRELPYTTALGRSWEPWMVYRELEANTIDEGGQTFVTDLHVTPRSGWTQIIVESEALVECHAQRDTVFLPRATRERNPLSNNPDIEVFDAPSRHLYYRGLRVYDLPHQARRTYNVLAQLDLTEDRTLKQPWWADHLIARHIAGTEDEDLLRAAATAAPDEYEARLDYPDPSDAALRVVNEAGAAAASGNLGRAVGARLLREAPVEDLWVRAPRPWVHAAEAGILLDAAGDEVNLADPELLDLIVATVNRVL